MRLLIKHNADVTVDVQAAFSLTDAVERLPIAHYAAMRCQATTLQWLLGFDNSDVNTLSSGQTCLHMAMASGPVRAMHLDAFPPTMALRREVARRFEQTMAVLLGRGADPFLRVSQSFPVETLLQLWASLKEQVEVADLWSILEMLLRAMQRADCKRFARFVRDLQENLEDYDDLDVHVAKLSLLCQQVLAVAAVSASA